VYVYVWIVEPPILTVVVLVLSYRRRLARLVSVGVPVMIVWKFDSCEADRLYRGTGTAYGQRPR